MEFLAQLWLPILVSAVAVFVASSLIHMVIKWHNSDYLKLANEDAVRAAINGSPPAPGQYVLPHCTSHQDFALPEVQKKFTEGPVAFMTVRASGMPNIVPSLVQWFVYSILIGVVCAYVASKAFPGGPPSWGAVARLVGALSFMAYAMGSVQLGIWMGKPWGSVAKDMADGAIYAAITGATFGWLWTR